MNAPVSRHATVRERRHFAEEVRRYRPLVTVLLSAIVMIPSFAELVAGNLTSVLFLMRLLDSLLIMGCLVWAATAVLIHYSVSSHGPHDDGGR